MTVFAYILSFFLQYCSFRNISNKIQIQSTDRIHFVALNAFVCAYVVFFTFTSSHFTVREFVFPLSCVVLCLLYIE